MTPTRKNNPAYTRFATATSISTVSTEDEQMAPRQNRKRIRHRPRSRGRRLGCGGGGDLVPTPIQPVPMTHPTAMSVRYSYAGQMPSVQKVAHSQKTSAEGRKEGLQITSPVYGQHSRVREGRWELERELRVFGGSEEESEADGEDLKGPMLEVMLGLFDGLDYDDDACC